MRDLLMLARQCGAALRLLLVATVVLGVLYPLAVTGVARVLLPWQAAGSLVTAAGERTTDPAEAVGSLLLGQPPAGPGLFVPRPSAGGWDTLATGGTNLGPESPDLLDAVRAARRQVARREAVPPAAVPPDAVTSSGSGLDPHVSPAYAALQVPRVAAAQGLPEDAVRRLVAAHTAGRTLGVLGEPRVDVLALNLAVLRAAGAGAGD